jgi:hypothetical protein
MAGENAPEVWLRGPLPDYPPALMPVAHALLQAREDVERVAGRATAEELWQRPGGAASGGYHLQHLSGSLDRLFTYARGESLSEEQRAALLREGTAGASGAELVPAVVAQIDRALEQLRHTAVDGLYAAREVGRARLPSTVLGLLFHAAEHTSRHVGQLITTMKVVRGSAAGIAVVILLMLSAGRTAAQEVSGPQDSVTSQIRSVLRAFYLHLENRNWDALSPYVLSPKLLERRGSPGEVEMVTKGRGRSRGSSHASASPRACPAKPPALVDEATISVDGDWAEVSVPRCSGSSAGVDELRMLYFEDRWRFIYTDLFDASSPSGRLEE